MDPEREKECMKENTATKRGFVTSLAILTRSRLEAIFIWSWNTFMACMIAGRGSPPFIPLALSVGAVGLITLSVYLYNDITDVNVDKLNSIKGDRPLPTGKASQKDALVIVYLSGLLGIVILLSVNVYSFLFGLMYFFLFNVYSYPKIRLKRRFLFKESIIALGIPLTSLIGIYAVSHSFVVHAFFASILFAIFTYMAQPVFTDSTDVEEDIVAGVKSLATVLSWKKRVQLLVTGWLAVIALIPLTYSMFEFNVVLPVYAVAGGLAFLCVVIPMLSEFEDAAFSKARKITYMYFILLQLFFVIGTVDVHLFS